MTILTPKPGDIVHVRMIVSRVEADGTIIAGTGSGPDIIPADAITHVEPQPLKVGDSVVRADAIIPKPVGELLAIRGPYAWVQWLAYSAPVGVEVSVLRRAYQ